VVFAKTLKGYPMLFSFYRNFMTSPEFGGKGER
jgi:hypothetical protein